MTAIVASTGYITIERFTPGKYLIALAFTSQVANRSVLARSYGVSTA